MRKVVMVLVFPLLVFAQDEMASQIEPVAAEGVVQEAPLVEESIPLETDSLVKDSVAVNHEDTVEEAVATEEVVTEESMPEGPAVAETVAEEMVQAVKEEQVSEKGGKPWEFGIDASALVSFNTYSKSWAGSEQASFAWNVRVVADANKQFAKTFRWENNLLVEFGRSRFQQAPAAGDAERPDWDEWGVSADEIDYKTVGIFTLDRVIDPYVNARFQTTFYNTHLANTNVQYFNWVRFSEGAGALMSLLKDRENQALDFSLGFVTYQNIDRKVDVYSDFGFEFVTKYSATIKKDVLRYITYLNLYQAFAVGNEVEREALSGDKWKGIDIEWKNELAINVTRYLMFSYTNQMLYDREVSERVRFKQYMSMGVAFARDNDARKEYKAAKK